MRNLFITDIWSLRLMGVCAGLGFLLLVNSLWQPSAHLPVPDDAEPQAVSVETSEDAQDPDAPDADVAEGLEAVTAPARDVKPLPGYGVTVQRPLFFATRRPAPIKPKLAKPKAPPKPKFPPRSNLNGVRLTGVIMTADKAFGLLSMPGQSELKRAREGEVIQGWKVSAVEEDALVLNNGEEDFRMALWEEKPGQGGAVAAGHR